MTDPVPGAGTGRGTAPSYAVFPVTGIGEVGVGTDLAAEVARRVTLADGDVVVVTSKVVSKAEGRVVPGDREGLLAGETDRVVARRGPTVVVRTPWGLVMAAGGIDASNVAPGSVVLLPRDPDASARRLRAGLARHAAVNVGVVVSDTSGRAWRTGQTDVAVGAAGVVALEDLSGQVDGYGNPLRVTSPALADELAGAGDLVKGKLRGCPVAVVRGLGGLVLPPDDHGSGARVLLRPEEEDLFGYGAREAVVRAVLAAAGADAGSPPAGRGFGAVAGAAEVAAVLRRLLGDRATVTVDDSGHAAHGGAGVEVRLRGATPGTGTADAVHVGVLAGAHRWHVVHRDPMTVRLAPETSPRGTDRTGPPSP